MALVLLVKLWSALTLMNVEQNCVYLMMAGRAGDTLLSWRNGRWHWAFDAVLLLPHISFWIVVFVVVTLIFSMDSINEAICCHIDSFHVVMSFLNLCKKEGCDDNVDGDGGDDDLGHDEYWS